MPVIRRLFGITDDAIPGGSSYDDLLVGAGGTELKAIPDATIFWPVTGGAVDKNLERLGREDEVRGRRPALPPMPFRARPVITFPVPAYRSVLEKIVKKALGGTDTVVGTVSPYTHTIDALGFGSTALPAFHIQLVRDDVNLKVSGNSIQRFTMNFPLDGEGTCEVEAFGLYNQMYAAAIPSATFTDVNDVLMLRDAKAFFDPTSVPAAPGTITGTQIPDLQGFEFTWTNNLNPKFYAGRNISTLAIGTPPLTRKVWWVEENKLGASQDVTFALQFGNPSVAQELAAEYGQIQKLVVDIAGGPITGGVELLRVTIYNGEWTGGGADALSARDDLNSRFEGGAFYSQADSKDVKIEFVNSSATPLV